ncbi:MAG: hypothetical protein M1816_007561 [Peltula sp. TS41687]|nr:MAG: hypothetical protein M1816_007561 [Peltula sp. TS41687]
MEKLPVEIILKIVHQLGARYSLKPELSGCVTFSREWQAVVEQRTFQSLVLKSTELDDFDRIVVGHRRASLELLTFHVILPSYSDRARAKFETTEDRLANNHAFTAALHGLFVSSTPICFCLSAYSPTDDTAAEHPPAIHGDLHEHRYEHSFLRLVPLNRPADDNLGHDDDLFPPVSPISGFEVKNNKSRGSRLPRGGSNRPRSWRFPLSFLS